jgi:hypothetical protein
MTEPPKPTEKLDTPSKAQGNRAKPSKRNELRRWLDQHPGEIGECEYAALRAALAPISDSYLRKLLRDSGAPLAPMIAGVRQSNLDELETSLLALLNEYDECEGDPSKRVAIRALIITAKDHARWATKRAREASKEEAVSNKEEMVLWMITWLENPPVFRQWIRLRRQTPQLLP